MVKLIVFLAIATIVLWSSFAWVNLTIQAQDEAGEKQQAYNPLDWLIVVGIFLGIYIAEYWLAKIPAIGYAATAVIVLLPLILQVVLFSKGRSATKITLWNLLGYYLCAIAAIRPQNSDKAFGIISIEAVWIAAFIIVLGVCRAFGVRRDLVKDAKEAAAKLKAAKEAKKEAKKDAEPVVIGDESADVVDVERKMIRDRLKNIACILGALVFVSVAVVSGLLMFC